MKHSMKCSNTVEPLSILITNGVIMFTKMKILFLLFVSAQCNAPVNVDAA